MIRLLNVSKAFNRGQINEVSALEALDLEIAPQEYLVLVGANGSGKSTLLNAIAGSVGIDEGKIMMEGKEVNRLKDYQRSPWVARIFQNPLSGTAPDLSILDNFRLASLRTRSKSLKLGTSRAFKEIVREKVALLDMGLENKLGQKMGTLSGGQRQALTLMMAVMDEAKILLLDEPAAALDPKSARNLMEKADMVIRDFRLTAILVTHNLKDAHTYGQRLIQMQEGKIIRDCSKEEKNSLALEDLFHWFA